MLKVYTFKEIIDRIYKTIQISKQSEFALYLEKSPSTISKIFSETYIIPRNWFDILYDKHKINPLWLVSGEGNKFLKSNEIPPDFYNEYKELAKKIRHSQGLVTLPLSSFPLPEKDSTASFSVREDYREDNDKLLNDFINNDKIDKTNISEINFKIRANSLDNSNANELSFSTGLSGNVYHSIETNVYSCTGSKLLKTNNFINLPPKESIKIVSFDSSCMEPIIQSSSLLLIDSEYIFDFDPNAIFAFWFPNTGFILAHVLIEKEKIFFQFANKEFVNFSCEIPEAQNHYKGRLIGTLLP